HVLLARIWRRLLRGGGRVQPHHALPAPGFAAIPVNLLDDDRGVGVEPQTRSRPTGLREGAGESGSESSRQGERERSFPQGFPLVGDRTGATDAGGKRLGRSLPSPVKGAAMPPERRGHASKAPAACAAVVQSSNPSACASAQTGSARRTPGRETRRRPPRRRPSPPLRA